MTGRPAALALVALASVALAGSGCGDDDEPAAAGPPAIRVPAEVAGKSQPRQAYVKPLGAAVLSTQAVADPGYVRAFVTHFTSLTPEAGTRWQAIHPDEDRFDFEEADAVLDLARSTGKQVRGHALVEPEDLPAWMSERDWDRHELAGVLSEHVEAVVGRYRGRVAEWDVVDGMLDREGRHVRSVLFEVLGESYIDIALRAARRADPGARLFIEDDGMEVPGRKSFAMLALVRRLKARGAPLDAIGFHNRASARRYPTRDQLLGTFEAYSRLGLDTAITQMDVVVEEGSDLADQAEAFGAAAAACLAARSCIGLTVWGVTDRYAAREAPFRPLLFDAFAAPKPALTAVVQRFLR